METTWKSVYPDHKLDVTSEEDSSPRSLVNADMKLKPHYFD